MKTITLTGINLNRTVNAFHNHLVLQRSQNGGQSALCAYQHIHNPERHYPNYLRYEHIQLHYRSRVHIIKLPAK